MRILVLPLSALAIALTVSAQANLKATSASETGALYLPATLNKTLRAERTHPGAAVRFTLEEPVLLGHGVVMPEGAHLQGHVTEASKLDEGRASRLAIVVETAEWKHQKVQLRAFISGVVTRREVSQQKTGDWRCQPLLEKPVLSNRNTLNGGPGTAVPKPRECSGNLGAVGEERVVRDRRADLKDVVLHRNPLDGSTVLFSHKRNIKLEAGTVLMLRNLSADQSVQAEVISEK
jgi:hypothetical protein